MTDVKPHQLVHKFGHHEEKSKTITAVKFPVNCSYLGNDYKLTKKTVDLNINFDVIEGNLLFLIGMPTLKAMKSQVNFQRMNIRIIINNRPFRTALIDDGNHTLLDCRPTSFGNHS